MSNRNFINAVTFTLDENIFADELLVCVSQQGARQQVRFAQYLEAIANAENFATHIRKFDHRLHDRAKSRDGAASQIIAVGKAPWQNNAVVSRKRAEIFVLMPEHSHLLAKIIGKCIIDVSIAIRPWENNNAEF